MKNNKKLKVYVFLAFIVLSISSLSFLELDRKNSINNYLKDESQKFYLNYSVIYNDYKNIAELIFKTHIQNKNILELFAKRDREGLKEYLNDNYQKLRVFNVRQLHFHLPNNDSFLRMHRPNKFGDNLSKARKTVKYVNENKKYIHGFEEGKIFNGFRFVYPLFLDEKHLGSVEVSFSALFFIQEISKSYNVSANFLINKKVVAQKVFKEEQKNYIQSPLRDYFYQRAIYEKFDLKKYNRKIDEDFEDKILNKMEKGELFAIFVEEFKEIAIFLPLQNPITKDVVAYIKINKNDTEISKMNSSFLSYSILSILLIVAVILYLYSQYKYQFALQNEVNKKTKKLNDLNNHLQEIIEKEVAENKRKDELMIAQSRHAAMGEMISMIAHQWRQPIAVVSMGVNNLLADIELDMLDEKELKTIAKDILDQTEYLTKTIDDFRDFFKPEKSSEKVEIKGIFDEALKIVGKSLENNSVKVNVNCDVSNPIETYSRELLQVFINIMKNANEALNEIDEKNRIINIICFDKDNYIEIEVFNNGKNIKEELLSKIFEPYFTTKNEKTGTGLGLYISKIIIEKHLFGELSVENSNNGVTFIIKLPYKLKGENDGK